MNDAPSPASSQEASHSFLKVILAMAVGGFSIGTGEFVIMGLLPDVAQSLDISIPTTGHLISGYALGVVVGAPVLAVLTARLSRRSLLMLLMLFYAVGNFASSASPDYHAMFLLRLLSGLPHGTYFGVASLVAATLAPPGMRAQAIGFLMLGLTGATVLGVPVATALGQWLGWRVAFALVGLIALAAVFLIWRWVPNIAASEGASPWRELGALKRKQVWLTLGIAGIGFGGMFSVFSYVKPTLMNLAGLPLAWVPVMLVMLGIGMVGGNLIGARLADRALMPTIGGILIWAVLVLGLFTFTSHNLWLGSLNVLLIGSIVALGATLQIRLMEVAGDAQTLAAALNHSAFNLANALGAWLGGRAIDAGLGWDSTGWVGMLLALGGLIVFGISYADMRRHGNSQHA